MLVAIPPEAKRGSGPEIAVVFDNTSIVTFASVSAVNARTLIFLFATAGTMVFDPALVALIFANFCIVFSPILYK
jgi:hypothetical protein